MKLNFKAGKAHVEQEAASQKPKSDQRILVVDDEPTNLKVMEGILGKSYPLVCFESAAEALAYIDKGGEDTDFAVVVSDYRMPEMNGVEFLQALKKREHPAPRIMLTGFAAMDNVVAAINRGGIFQYVTKPIDAEVVTHAVAEAVAVRQMKAENAKLLSKVKELMETNSELYKTLDHNGIELEKPNTGLPGSKPQHVELCVLFADVRGFTSLTHEVEPAELLETLQAIFLPMHRLVYESGGIVDKHLGDGLMALFGLSGRGGTRAATVAATERIVAATSEVISGLKPPFDKLRVSLGVAYGEVVMGMMGSERRSELAVIGEPANLAARLQEFTKAAIQSERGAETLGKFNKVMAAFDHAVIDGVETKAHIRELPKEMRVRDFPDVSKVGILSD